MSDGPCPLQGLRILLVEDEYVIADEMEEWLRAAGADVLGPAPSAAQALDLIDGMRGAVDAAVLDANLGEGGTASPVARRLDELGVPYLFATGDVRGAPVASERAHPRLEKPVSHQGLLRALAQVLALRPPLRG